MFVNVLSCTFWRLVQHISHSIIHHVERMTVPSTKSLILWRCESPYHLHEWQICLCAVWTNWVVVHLQVSTFLLPALHQVSTLEKTTCRQCSILSILLSNFHHKSPVLGCCSFHELRGNWLSCLVCPGLSDAVEASTLGFLTLHRETKFIIGFDSAVTPSTPDSFCVLVDITSRQLVELKWQMFNEHKRWFHSSRVRFPWSVCLRVGSWCQCVWLGFWGPNWFDRITNQEQLCGFWNYVSW